MFERLKHLRAGSKACEPSTRIKPKPRLNEVTVRILSESNTDYVQTFLLDTLKHSKFEYKGKTYNLPSDEAGHYLIGFWAFDKKLAQFFTLHKTLAALFDWFGLQKRATVDMGFLYKEGEPDPINLEDFALPHDFALDNYNLERNASLEGAFKETDDKLKGVRGGFGAALPWVLLAVIVIAAAIFLVIYMQNGSGPDLVQITNNATLTPTPKPTLRPLP